MKSTLVLFALVCGAFSLADYTLDYNRTAGVNLTNAERDFPYRNCTAVDVVLRRQSYNAYYATCNGVTDGPSVIGSGIIIGNSTSDEGEFYVPPSLFGFEYKTKNELSYLQLASMIYYKSQPADPVFDTFIAVTFPGVVELDKENRYIKYVSFNTSGKTGAQAWSPLKRVATNDTTVTAFLTTMTAENGAQFRLTMLISNVAGVVQYGYTPVSPKSINYIVEVSNWPYKSPLYKLGLIVGTAIKINEGHFSDNYTTREDSQEKLLSYVGMPGYGVVDKQVVPLMTITDASSIIRRTPLVISTDAVGLLNDFLFNDKGIYRFRCVTFPEEAEDMIYGVAFGAGDPIYSRIKIPTGEYTSSASSVILSLVAVLLALALIF
jgi:hypothetical protein